MSRHGTRSLTVSNRGKRTDEPHELCVVMACHELVCALPARWVERLVLPDEISKVVGSQKPGSAKPSASPPLVALGEQQFVSFNLGTLLALEPLRAAWILLRVPYRDNEIAIALNTGTCLVVQSLPLGVPLPPGLFRARSGAISGVFPAGLVKGRAVKANAGVWIDPLRLWTDDELAAAAAAQTDARKES